MLRLPNRKSIAVVDHSRFEQLQLKSSRADTSVLVCVSLPFCFIHLYQLVKCVCESGCMRSHQPLVCIFVDGGVVSSCCLFAFLLYSIFIVTLRLLEQIARISFSVRVWEKKRTSWKHRQTANTNKDTANANAFIKTLEDTQYRLPPPCDIIVWHSY